MSTDHNRSKEGIYPLADACRLGDASQVRGLLGGGSNPCIPDGDGYTPFHYAANNTEILEQLLTSCDTLANLNPCSFQGETPLHLACLNGNLESAQLLVSRGADLVARDGKGNSVLHLSAASGSTQLIHWINRQVKDLLNSTNKDGDTPAHCAARLGCREALNTLSELGASMELKNNWNRTPSEEFQIFNYRTTAVIRRRSSLRLEVEGKNGHAARAVLHEGMRESRSHSEPRLPRKKTGGREKERCDGSQSATNVTTDTEFSEGCHRVNGIGGGGLRRVASPLASNSLTYTGAISPSESKDTATKNTTPCSNSATGPTTVSNHVSNSGRPKTQLASKSDRRPVNKGNGSYTGSNSATNIIPDTGRSGGAGTPVSEHREMGRKEKYNITKTRAEELRFEGKSSSQSEKLQRRTKKVRAESESSGVRTRSHTPDLGTRGRAKSDVQQRPKQESLV